MEIISLLRHPVPPASPPTATYSGTSGSATFEARPFESLRLFVADGIRRIVQRGVVEHQRHVVRQLFLG